MKRVVTPDLGSKVRARGYMVRYSSVRKWREQNPDAETEYPDQGVKGLKRVRESFSGVYVGIRVLKHKRWWATDRGTMDEQWYSSDTWLTVWLVAYKDRAKPRLVLPTDVEVPQ